ncbi:hypothetical protein IE81DRAFT_84812 [Ceraceosorus guamensis]|uniref:Zn(2)-C6 fungal-type domain-containing protein n=1 Tax=Ceraceosorus guamensis TaxID=1522189 RepID=A0A316WAY8_9BASI|nr:hypothetical protein IE81DRAFT_84812 [Ceraceosorus guamensis]PWN46148.1 hypothetical protein IE81DRAFT_84812 [Ceraceosorus guamensis]
MTGSSPPERSASTTAAAFGFFASQPPMREAPLSSHQASTNASHEERLAPPNCPPSHPPQLSPQPLRPHTFQRMPVGMNVASTSTRTDRATPDVLPHSRTNTAPQGPSHSPVASSSSSIASPTAWSGSYAQQAAMRLHAISTGTPHPAPYPLTNPDHPAFDEALNASVAEPLGQASASNSPGTVRTHTSVDQPEKVTAAKKGKGSAKKADGSSRSKVVKGKSKAKTENAGQVGPSKGDGSASEVSGDELVEDRKPGWKRRRVVVACDRCRHKKIRCKGLPNSRNICNNCEGMGYECTFDVSPTRSRGKYEILESKVSTLLSALRSVAPDLAEQYDRGQLGAGPPAMTTMTNQSRRVSVDSTGVNASSSSVREDVTTRSVMLHDHEEGRPRFFGANTNRAMLAGLDSRPPSPLRQARTGSDAAPGTENAAKARDSKSAQPTESEKLHASTAWTSTQRAEEVSRGHVHYPTNSLEWVMNLRRRNLCGVGRDDLDFATPSWKNRYRLPGQEVLRSLFDVYFGLLHPMIPILHRPSMEQDIAAGRAEVDVAFRGLVFTVLAIAARYSNDPRCWSDRSCPQTAGDDFAAASRLYHQVHSASLINIQVLSLSCFFASANMGPGVSWTLLGVAIRGIFDIGAHQERTLVGLSLLEQELLRRTFWNLVTLDCIFAVNMGRPLGIRLSDCNVNLPRCLSDEDLTASISTPGLGSQVKILQSSVRKLQYTDMVSLLARVDDWAKSAPKTTYPPGQAVLDCASTEVRMYIMKPFLRRKDDTGYLRKMLMPQCTDAARKSAHSAVLIWKGLQDAGARECNFPCHTVWISSTTFMITVWHQQPGEELLRDAELIEHCLWIFDSLDWRCTSGLLRRAYRILCGIAERLLPHLANERQDSIKKYMIKRQGSKFDSGSLGDADKSGHPALIQRRGSPGTISMAAWNQWKATASSSSSSRATIARLTNSNPALNRPPHAPEVFGQATNHGLLPESAQTGTGVQQDWPPWAEGEFTANWQGGQFPNSWSPIESGAFGGRGEADDIAWADYFLRFLNEGQPEGLPASHAPSFSNTSSFYGSNYGPLTGT